MVRGRLAVMALFCLSLGAAAADPGRAVVDPAFNPMTGLRPAQKVQFPAIKDWSSLRIRLERTACYGWCPVYTVEVSGDGTVTFVGERFVAAKGTHAAKIPREKVEALYRAFAKADFFWTNDRYEGAITDMPTQIISIAFDGHHKTVVDYAGHTAGMPKAIDELEDMVDQVAGTAVWIGHEREP